MKKLILCLFATVLVSTVSHAQKKLTIQSSVTEQEYKAMDETDKKIVSYIDAAIAGLKAMNLNQNAKKTMHATVSLSNNDNNKIENMVAISESEGNLESMQSCTICGIGSGYTCYKRLKPQLSNGPVIITVILVGECVQLSW